MAIKPISVGTPYQTDTPGSPSVGIIDPTTGVQTSDFGTPIARSPVTPKPSKPRPPAKMADSTFNPFGLGTNFMKGTPNVSPNPSSPRPSSELRSTVSSEPSKEGRKKLVKQAASERRSDRLAARQDRLSAMATAENESRTRGEIKPSQIRRARNKASIRADVKAGRKVAGSGGGFTPISFRPPSNAREAAIAKQVEEFQKRELIRRLRNSGGIGNISQGA